MIGEEQLIAWDHQLLASYARSWQEGAQRAGHWLKCGQGCSSCCIGVFEITALDAWRLARGLAELARQHPEVAEGIRARAQAQWALLKKEFPGATGTGALGEEDQAREAFCRRFAYLPCPSLEPKTGSCLLYQYRPLSCRSFGLPCHIGEEELPACPLNFSGASEEEISRAKVVIDAEALEDALLAAMGHPPETIVAAVAAGVYSWSPRRVEEPSACAGA